MDVVDAERLARGLLSCQPRRLRHVTAVAQLAARLAPHLGIDAYPLVAGAWLHDIGYASDVSHTGFHPLDGARCLRLKDAPASLTNMVAHHSYAVIEAELRGLRSELEAEFPYDPALPHDLLCYCDMTTGPSGERVAVHERLSEIRKRYGPDDLVTQFIIQAEEDIVETVERVEKRLAAAAQST